MDSGVVAAKAAAVSSRVMGHWWLLAEMACLLGIVETVFDAFLGGLQIRNKTWAACGLGVGTFRVGRTGSFMKYVYILSGSVPSYGMSSELERNQRPNFQMTNREASAHRRSLGNAAAASEKGTPLPPPSGRHTRVRRSLLETTTQRTTAAEGRIISRAPPPLSAASVAAT